MAILIGARRVVWRVGWTILPKILGDPIPTQNPDNWLVSTSPPYITDLSRTVT